MDRTIKIKVCGIREPQNIEKLMQCSIDYMGFIFYPKSKRYVGEISDEFKTVLSSLPSQIQTTAVTINESLESLSALVGAYPFNALQLHGDESPSFVQKVRQQHPEIILIKAIPVGKDHLLNPNIGAYEGYVDFFLFDTYTKEYGGSGKVFNHNLLDNYKLETPFFLSGGISIEILPQLKKWNHPKWYGVDLNSRFETHPGHKNITLLKSFVQNWDMPD